MRVKIILTVLCVLLTASTLLTLVAAADFDTFPVLSLDSGPSPIMTLPMASVDFTGAGIMGDSGTSGASGAPANIQSIPTIIGTPVIPTGTIPSTSDQISAITSLPINLVETPLQGESANAASTPSADMVHPTPLVTTGDSSGTASVTGEGSGTATITGDTGIISPPINQGTIGSSG